MVKQERRAPPEGYACQLIEAARGRERGEGRGNSRHSLRRCLIPCSLFAVAACASWGEARRDLSDDLLGTEEYFGTCVFCAVLLPASCSLSDVGCLL